MPKIKVIGRIKLLEEQREDLLKLGVRAEDIVVDDPKSRDDVEEIIRRVGDAEAIIVNISTNITRRVIESCKNLKFIQTWSTGLDNVDCVAAKEANIIVKNVPEFSSDSVAEKTLATMVLVANQFIEASQDVKRGGWRYKDFPGVELRGKTLCIIGFGKIGHRVAELAKAYGMAIIPINSKATREDLKKALSCSDFVTLHCPLTPNTYHLLGEKEFQAMKKGAYLVNNSRGGVVDEAALLQALNDGIVRYAGIDVFEKEPPEKDNPLIDHPRVFVTPHTAWHTEEAVCRLSDVCINNLRDYLNSLEKPTEKNKNIVHA